MNFMSLYKLLPEITEMESLAEMFPDYVSLKKLNVVKSQKYEYPIYGLVIGNQNKQVPTLGLFGAVHGLERIGTQVILSYLYQLKKRLSWDDEFKEQLKTRRIVTIPMVNPWGVATNHRCNINGVDLNRNAPVEGDGPMTPLVCGHRYSNKLPWYRGKINEAMEVEAQTMIDFVKAELFSSPVSIAVDVHSGFGMKDQIWYPYAHTNKPFPYMDQFTRLRQLFEDTFPHHIYRFESQTAHYTINGDLWDYAVLEHFKSKNPNVFIPFTLELGSFQWVKKNPLQLMNLFGLFNPIKPHRYSRVMRRHIFLFDFLLRAARNSKSWA
jgi:hypothetical protein